MRHMSSSRKTQHGGFTIIEVLVLITVSAILLPLIMDTLASYYFGNINSLNQSTQNTDARTALRVIENDLAFSPSFLEAVTVPSPLLGPGNSTSGSSTWTANRDRLIATTYTTSTSAGQQVPIIYRAMNDDNCSRPTTEMVLRNTVIYFIAPDLHEATVKNLYRRTLAGSTSSLCPGSPTTYDQKTTCKADVATGVCTRTAEVGTDALLMRDIDTFTLEYYADPTNSTPLSLTSDPAIAESVTVSIVPKKRGNVVPEKVSTRITPIR